MTRDEFKQFTKWFKEIVRIGAEYDFLDSLANDYDSEKDRAGMRVKDPTSFWYQHAGLLDVSLSSTRLIFQDNIDSAVPSSLFYDVDYKVKVFEELKTKIAVERKHHKEQAKRAQKTEELRQENAQKATEEYEKERALKAIMKWPELLEDIKKTKEGFIKIAKKIK